MPLIFSRLCSSQSLSALRVFRSQSMLSSVFSCLLYPKAPDFRLIQTQYINSPILPYTLYTFSHFFAIPLPFYISRSFLILHIVRILIHFVCIFIFRIFYNK